MLSNCKKKKKIKAVPALLMPVSSQENKNRVKRVQLYASTLFYRCNMLKSTFSGFCRCNNILKLIIQ